MSETQAIYTTTQFDEYEEVTTTVSNREEYFTISDRFHRVYLKLQFIKTSDDEYFTMKFYVYINEASDLWCIDRQICGIDLLADQKRLTPRKLNQSTSCRTTWDYNRKRFRQDTINSRGHRHYIFHDAKQCDLHEFDFEVADILTICNSNEIKGRISLGKRLLATEDSTKELNEKITAYLKDELCLLYNDAIGEGVNQHNLERARAKRAEIETQREDFRKFRKEEVQKSNKKFKIVLWILLLLVGSCSVALFV
nr:hypothetical protein 4 [Paracoccaceae bacterium]